MPRRERRGRRLPESAGAFSSGEETRYDATVGDLSAETFTEHAYDFGMFTYVQELEDQKFHVVNFWVEQMRPGGGPKRRGPSPD